MSLRRAPTKPVVETTTLSTNGGGLFKDLFSKPVSQPTQPTRVTKPDEPIGMPLRPRDPSDDLDVQNFELVGEIKPFESLDNGKVLALEGAVRSDTQANEADEADEAGEDQDRSGLSRAQLAFMNEVLGDQRGQRDERGQRTDRNPFQGGVVFSLHVRRITDDNQRNAMADVIKKYVENRLQSKMSLTDTLLWKNKVKFAISQVRSTCAPILSETVLMWASTDVSSYKLLVKTTLSTERTYTQTHMAAFFGALFNPYGSRVELAIEGANEESLSYTHDKSYFTDWDQTNQFKPQGDGDEDFDKFVNFGNKAFDTFTASEFTRDATDSSDATDPSARRRRM